MDYYYDGTAVVEERNAGGLLAHYRYAGKLYSLTDGTNSQYYHQDALGSTTDLTDDTGTTKASYFLNPWGMIVDSIGDSVNRRIFTGKETDTNTGLIYFGARYYDPETARFITQDSYLGKQDEPPSLHRYLYAYSNPTVYVDLEGYAAWDVLNDIAGGLKTAGVEGWKGTKTAVKTTWKALPQLNQKFSSGFDQALDNAYGTALQNNVPGMKNPLVQAGITAGITGTKTMLGMGSYPLVKAGQASEYSADPTQLQNFPVLGTGVRDIYRAHKAYEENPTLENGLQVFQAGAGTFLEVVGAGYGAKTIKGSYGKTAPKSGMTVEAGTTKVVDETPVPNIKGRQISNVQRVSAAEANSLTPKSDIWSPPFPEGPGVRRFTTVDDLEFVRVHLNANKPQGSFLVRSKEIAHLNGDAEAIRQYLALDKAPTYISDIMVPTGTRMQVGVIGPQPKFGVYKNSGFQYQLIEEIPRDSFKNTRTLQ